MKIFDNFAELNISSLVESGGETILKLSENVVGNLSQVTQSQSTIHIMTAPTVL